MKSLYKFFLSLLIFSSAQIFATPNSVFWTNCTTAVYDVGVGHVDIDIYGSVFNRREEGELFAPDVGFSTGFFNWKDIKCSGGVDYLMAEDDPWYFNAKIGVAEDILFCKAPSMSIGIFNVGTRHSGSEPTSQNIVDIVFGKELPDAIGGNFYIGGFSGSRIIGKNRQGFMVAYTKSFCKTTDCCGTEYYKWGIAFDYASGKNTIGGLGLGFVYNFTPRINLMTGPVFFNSAEINGKWKWAVQVDIEFDVFKKANSC